MTLLLNLSYQTAFGEELVVNILPADTQGTESRYKMNTTDGYHWTCTLPGKDLGDTVRYYYGVVKNGVDSRNEWLVMPHLLKKVKGCDTYRVYDKWIDNPEDSFLYSSAMTDCVASRRHDMPKAGDDGHKGTVIVKVRAPQLRCNERLAIMGAGEALGDWEAMKALSMEEQAPNEWMAMIDAAKLKDGRMEFKFVVLDEEKDFMPMWENGFNRVVELPKLGRGEAVVYELSQASFPIYPWKGAGTVIPVFSLRSEGSFGVGDFGDLKKMVDWADKTHQRIIQILPIYDTTITHTWTDSYPYNSISIYALHPQYADLRQLPPLAGKSRMEHYRKLQQELNVLPQIDYERVNNAKIDYLHELYEQERTAIARNAAYKDFFGKNQEWLVPYAAFCYYRDLYGTASFNQWPDHHTLPEDERAAMAKPGSAWYRKVSFWYFVQFILDAQLREVHEYAQAHRVILKGDIPIGISRDGVEAWVEPRYFNLNGQAGAPPDAFSVNGQNWGFPTYNWDAMLADGCSWWVRRFRKMAEFFDAYRIDHVLGFFRIWEIPIDAVHGLLGQFSPSLGMTREEIEGYGLHFDEHRFTTPFIADWVLDRVFKEHAEEVRTTYLDREGDHYVMKPDFDTQRKVEKAFAGRTSDKDIWIRDGLYALISDVLFVRDHKDANKFHPRIGVQMDFIYETLWDCDKYVFNRLYNDYYYRRNNQFWYHEAMKKLPRLTEATRMLVCAEDLGMVPDCVPWVMNQLHILSLEIQSMPKDDTVRFGHLSRNPYRSVDTISTHDMSTLRQWWDEDEARTQDYYNTMLHRSDAAPHPLPGWLAKEIIARHLSCPSMLCLLSLQDWLSMDEQLRLADADAERINIPANPRHYWRYRMHLTIEQLMAADDFNDTISQLINQSGRK